MNPYLTTNLTTSSVIVRSVLNIKDKWKINFTTQHLGSRLLSSKFTRALCSQKTKSFTTLYLNAHVKKTNHFILNTSINNYSKLTQLTKIIRLMGLYKQPLVTH